MSTEPGERRRRRELERAREQEAQQAAAPQAVAPQGVAPRAAEPQAGGTPTPSAPAVAQAVAGPPAPALSRRELRELERARAAQELAAAPAVDAPARSMARPISPTARPAGLQAPVLKQWMPASKPPVAASGQKGAPEPVVAEPPVAKPLAAKPGAAKPVAGSPVVAKQSPPPKEAGPVSGRASTDAAADPVSPERPVTRQSRRSMRPQPAPTEAARTPVVNPPATTGTIRIVVPEATTGDRPARTEGSSTPGRAFPPVAPRRSALSPLVTSTDRGHASTRPLPSSATPPSAIPLSTGGNDFAWPTKEVAPGGEQTPAPDGSNVDDVVVAPPDRAPAHPARAGGAPLTPRWGHVPSGSFDAITRPPDDEETSPVTVESSAEAKDASPARRSAAYTWVQMLALALLAFVLGFIVWLLIKGSTDPGATGARAPEPATSSSGTSWPHLGDL